MAGTSDARTLAAALAQSADTELAQVFARRGVSPEATWHDFFDAADALLSAASVDRALTALTAPSLERLREGAGDAETAGWVLTAPDGRPYSAVATRLAERLSAAAPAAGEHDVVPPPPAGPAAEEAAAERAFSATGAVSDLLLWAMSFPIGRTGTGTVSANDRRRLIDAGAVADADELDDLLALAEAAELLSGLDREWQATPAAESWLDAHTADRWTALATGFATAMPAGLRTPEGGHLPVSAWPAAFPLDPEWATHAALLRRRARRLGLLADDDSEPAWSRGLRERGVPEVGPLAARLPGEIDRVYLQADLSAIAPGPLQPALERRLRTMTTRESRAQASTYRFSAETVAAAVAGGETAESLHEFLSELSLTGIPQPLAYLIDRATARHGLVRVGVDPESGRTVVTSEDADLLAAAGVDQALRPVGLVAHEGALVSRASAETVYWSLADARYPVVAVDADGAVRSPARRVGAPTRMTLPPEQRYARLIGDLRSATGPDAESAWLGRELEQAVRARAVIEVTVRLPDDSTRTFVLEATGLGGGRLRGRDRQADVERTLPVASIVSVASA